jgi:glycosyltransferase involved in cell wall biosynthesis
MVQEGYPPYPLVHASYRRLERRTLARCAKATFTAPGAVAYYAQRYPALRSRLELLENGYDESAFAGASATAKPDVSTKVTLLHSGSVYPYERDPRPFFAALAELKAERTASAGALRVVLRATGADDYLRPLVRDAGLEDIVELAPPVSYREALAEMLAADGLLLFQAGNCNYQVPAKLYEYLRARRPVLALTDAAGDTAAVLQRAGIDTIGQLDSRESIKAALVRFVGLVQSGRAPIASDASVSSASRAARTAQLAQIFEEAIRATEAAPDQAVAGSVRGSGKPGPLR